MAEVKRIDEGTANGMRAGAVVSTMSQAVQELVSNSIDAGASSVEVKVDLPSYRITIVDNGRGIPAEALRSLTATERASSKANSAVEMQHASTYGFRGEALYSLALTSLLEIQSRCAGKEPHAKVVREGEVLHFGTSRAPVRTGTIVTLRDAFFKWPVRRKAANEVTEMTRIKDCVSRMALVNNSVAITVQDSAKSKVVVRATATGSATRTFAQVFSSDKLSLARKLAFNFKQFRITGYLSPPSSTACHWSKEFQLVYVNCKSVRRLDFLQKAVNAAFAPCMALLAGRGGADGQGVVRRVRNPNASSGQRQELFPVFVLNLECPRSEVDIMSDPEKTWIEFSDWAAARNACISMLLAFLSRFSHAVPSSVLRDLRRAFHKNEGGGGDAWKPASPPPPPAARGASPDPGPSLSPPPMQLGTPDVGVSPAGVGSPLKSCVWMGRDREVGGIGEEVMEFQDEGFRGEGVLYPSPASRFGARDTGPSSSSSRMPDLSFSPGGGVGDDNMPSSSAAASPYFAASFEDHGKSRYHEGYDDDGHPTSSPYFARCHNYDGRRSPPDNRLRGRQLALGEYAGGEEECRRRRWDPRPCALGVEARAPYPPPSFAAVRYEGLGIEDNALSDQARGSGGHADSSGGGWAAEGPPGGRRMSDLLPPSEEEAPVFDDPPPPNETSSSAKALRGNGRHSSRNGGQRWQSGGGGPPPPRSIVSSTRGSRRGGWLRHLPGVTEMHPGEEDLDQGQQQLEDDAADQGSLSRLFHYVFADSDERRLPTGPERTGALDVRSSLPRLLPRGDGGGGGTAAGRKASVGVTVRRPPSPQFAFMNEERSYPGGAGAPPPAPSPPGRQRSPPPEARQHEALPPPSQENGGGGARTCNPVNQQQLGARARSSARATTSPCQSSGGLSCQGDGDTPGAWGAAPAFGGTAPLGPARRMASSSSSPKTGGAPANGGTPPLSKKRRRSETPGSSRGGANRRGSPSIGRWAGHRMEDAERHRSPPPPASDRRWGVVNNSPGGEGDGDGGVGLGDGWLGWARGHGRERNSGGGWWGRRGNDTPPSAAGDRATPAAEAPAEAPAKAAPASATPAPAPASATATATEAAPAAAVARLLQADNDGLGWHDDASPTPRGGTDEPRHHPERVGAASQAGAPLRLRDERVCAADGESLGLEAGVETAETTPREASVYNKEGDQTVRPAPAGGQQNACRVEGGGGSGSTRSGKEDRMRAAGAALAYDQDVLGGDGLGRDGEEEEELDTVDGVLGKFLATGDYDSCHVSDAGGAAVYSPQGPGGGRARKAGGEAEKAAAETDSRYNPLPGRRERQIPQVLQAGQDEVGAGAGAVAVTLTPEELGEALLIGQAGRKFILLRAKTGAVLCLDQHAADERVKLEELERQVFDEGRERRNVERLVLDPPEKLSITRSDAELLEEHREVLSSWQFEVRVNQAQQGSDGLTPVVTLTAVPMVCGVRLSVQDFVGFLHFLRESVEPGQSARRLRPPQVQHILNYKACHSAIRRAEEAAAEREDREMQEAVAREEAAARRKEAAAAAARSKAEAAAGEAARIAEAKAATEARAMAAAAELEASEAAKRKAKEEEEEKEEERKAKKDAAATAAPPGAKRQEHIVAPVPERGTSGERVATGLSGATAGPPAMTGGGSGGGGGGESLVVDMSLEVRLKKAIERGNALAVQAIHDEADQTPGADMKKIKKKCKKWLNKKEGEMREEQQRLLQANQPPPNPALGLRQAGPGFGVPTPPMAAAAAAQRPTQYEMFCPNVIAGQVIGRGGQTVNRLMKESRARIILKTYADKTGHDVVITGSPQAVQTGRRLVEDFYRSKGIEPTLLQPPSSAIAAAAAAGRPGGVVPRARLPDPMMPTEAMIGHLGRGRTMAGAGPAAAGMRAPSGAIPQGARPVAQPVAQPVMYGGGHGGDGGGGVDVSGGELPQLLRAARCEHHLERFQRDQLDGEVLLEMERRDFDRMGVTEAEQSRILSALKHAGEGGGGGGGPGAAGRPENSAQRVVTIVRGTSGGVATPVEVEDDDDDDDSDGLDPDHPDTCKICMDALVGILFLPCAHQCTCVRCGSGFVGKPCIICRQKVTRAQPVIRLRR